MTDAPIPDRQDAWPRLIAALAAAVCAVRTAWRLFCAWFAERFLNAETGLGLWLASGGTSAPVALFIEPDKASYILVILLSVLCTALGGWLLVVNPVKRSAKRQLAVSRKLTDLSVAAYKKSSKSRTGGDAR